MQLSLLDYTYPEHLVAQKPERPSRQLCVDSDGVREISRSQLLELFSPGDVLVLNQTRVEKRRLFAENREILFLRPDAEGLTWEVLFQSRDLKVGQSLNLPGDIQMTLEQKGRPQKVRLSRALSEEDFAKHGELPLPPYIQKARGERHARAEDASWYQTAWAVDPGSLACPTASLHFSSDDLAQIEARGVQICKLTLHVGLGTFLPVVVEDLKDHEMHVEEVRIPRATWESVQNAHREGKKVWALGTTVTRALESAALGLLPCEGSGDFSGPTQLLIQPGFEFQIVDRLLTNFHQPRSTLLALVAAFAGLARVREAYQIAIEMQFRLFSYGDLSIWTRNDSPQETI